jgi:hypothetical protein
VSTLVEGAVVLGRFLESSTLPKHDVNVVSVVHCSFLGDASVFFSYLAGITVLIQ